MQWSWCEVDRCRSCLVVRCSKWNKSWTLGRHSETGRMSAYTLIAAGKRTSRRVRLVPKADIASLRFCLLDQPIRAENQARENAIKYIHWIKNVGPLTGPGTSDCKTFRV